MKDPTGFLAQNNELNKYVSYITSKKVHILVLPPLYKAYLMPTVFSISSSAGHIG